MAGRQVVYQVAASLDGFIAGPNGEHDWIPMDPDIDFKALVARFDTFLLGRRTYEMSRGQGPGFGGAAVFVFSRTLSPAAHPGVTIVGDDAAGVVRDLKTRPGRDIWLFGGGELFASLLGAGVVDRVEVAVTPVLLGAGLPLLPTAVPGARLTLDRHRVYPKSGIAMLEYSVAHG
jgi:dihydrofolate reductase